jgi:protocatechuate 3,4-dioxygenase beta subunit
VLLSLALAGAVAISAHAQAPKRPPTTSAAAIVITGRVVTDSTGDPIRNARVTLFPESQETPVVLTDAAGAFRLTAPLGRFSVVASKTGYARADATPAVSGQPVEVRLKKGAAIVGRVVDERGDPVVGVQVAALTQLSTGNNPTTAALTSTDDRGEYRLAGLSDGTFVVGVSTLAAVGPVRTRIADPRTTYYPGTAALGEAQALPLQPGEERRGTDIVVPADRLAGMPSGLFANRFLRPRQDSAFPISRAQSSAPRPTDGSVRGRVVSIDGAPISLAQVYLFASINAESEMATTDEEGRFEFGAVAAGTLLVSVTKPGYTQVESGQALQSFPMGRATSSPTPNDVQFGRRFEHTAVSTETVDLQMARWSTLSGTVADEYGDPIQGVGVEVLRVQYEAGRRRLVSAGTSRLTDDLGRYRIYGLAPGGYIVSAAVGQVSSEDLPGYGRAYFPGTPNAGEAQYVSVGLAQDVGFVDFSMSRVHTARVTGIVLGPTGEPSAPGALTLAPSQRSSSVTSVAVGARIAPDGTFVFPNVPQGQYVIQAYRGRSNAHTEGEFGAVLVSVNTADVIGVIVRTSSGSSVTGRFRFDVENPTTTPEPSDFGLTAIPIDLEMSPPNNPASADIHRDWTFDMSGLNGPRRLQMVRTPPGFALEEIRVNGVDVTDRAISLGTRAQSLASVEVVLTDRVTELSGTVVDDRGRPVGGARVILFSTDRQQWYPASRYLRHSSASQDGTFTVTGLPVGSYAAAAVTAIPAGAEDAWQDPQFLESLIPGASMIGVADRQKVVLTLRLHSR